MAPPLPSPQTTHCPSFFAFHGFQSPPGLFALSVLWPTSVLFFVIMNQQKVQKYGVKAIRQKKKAIPEEANYQSRRIATDTTKEIPGGFGDMKIRPGDPNSAVGGIKTKYLMHVSQSHSMPLPS